MLGKILYMEYASGLFIDQNLPDRHTAWPLENDLGIRIRHSEMRDPRRRQSAAPHEAVFRGARPTGLNGETSYAVTEPQQRAGHIAVPEFETVRVFPLHRDTRAATV